MPQHVQIRTGARLHFGPLSYLPNRGRHFGGIGLMIAQPGYEVRAGLELHGLMVDSGGIEERSILSRWREAYPEKNFSPVRLETVTPLPCHQGLGSGTQRAFAVAEAVMRLSGSNDISLQDLVRITGRGRRSAIGIHGYFQGGFLVDAGHHPGESTLGELSTRVDFPDNWRILLAFPRDVSAGASGEQELCQFEKLSPMPEVTTGHLCRLVLTEILPALHSQDMTAFNRAVGEYGQRVGEFFAPVQGGVFRSPIIQKVADYLRTVTDTCLVQSSWGPAAAIICSSEATAQARQEELSSRFGKAINWQITSPLNRGREILTR